MEVFIALVDIYVEHTKHLDQQRKVCLVWGPLSIDTRARQGLSLQSQHDLLFF